MAEEYYERLDSRGKMIKIPRVRTLQEAFLIAEGFEGLDDILGYPFSTFSLHPLSYIS